MTMARFVSIVAALVCAALAFWVTADGKVDAHLPVLERSIHAERVTRAVEGRGWVPSRTAVLESDADSAAVGTPYALPPGYDLLVTALHRRSLPSVQRLMIPAAERPPSEHVSAEERVEIEGLVDRVPRGLHVLLTFLTALIAGGLIRGVTAAGPLPVAVGGLLAGACIAFLPLTRDHQALAACLHLASLGVLSFALRPKAIDQPFWSAARGTLAGLLAGWMIISWTPSSLWVVLIELVFLLRLFLRFQDENGRPMRARGLPVLTTAFHKAALIVVLPAAIESPYTASSPWGVLDLSWFHIAWLSIGWLVFAPYALAPRIATTRRFVALLPALLVLGFLLLGTDSPSGVADAFRRLTWPSSERFGNVYIAALMLCAPIVLWMTVRLSRSAPSVLPFVVTLPIALLVAFGQQQLSLAVAAPFAVLLALAAVRLIGRTASEPS